MTNQLAIREEMPISEIAQAFVKSGYFQDTRDVSQAIVKIMAGREFGYGAFASMNGIHIIQGKPSLGADLMAAAVKRSGRYDYRVRQMDNTACTIEFFQGTESLGVSTFTADDARKAGTKNMDKFPRNMLFARAMSNGVRWFVPDVFGTAVYTPEEMGADVDEEGRIILGTIAPPVVTVTTPSHSGNTGTSRPYSPEMVKAKMLAYAEAAEKKGATINGDRNMIVPNLEKLFGGEGAADKRHTITRYLFGVASSKDLTDAQLLALKRWMSYQQVDDEWVPDPLAVKEANAIYTAALEAEGQQHLFPQA